MSVPALEESTHDLSLPCLIRPKDEDAMGFDFHFNATVLLCIRQPPHDALLRRMIGVVRKAVRSNVQHKVVIFSMLRDDNVVAQRLKEG